MKREGTHITRVTQAQLLVFNFALQAYEYYSAFMQCILAPSNVRALGAAAARDDLAVRVVHLPQGGPTYTYTLEGLA